MSSTSAPRGSPSEKLLARERVRQETEELLDFMRALTHDEEHVEPVRAIKEARLATLQVELKPTPDGRMYTLFVRTISPSLITPASAAGEPVLTINFGGESPQTDAEFVGLVSAVARKAVEHQTARALVAIAEAAGVHATEAQLLASIQGMPSARLAALPREYEASIREFQEAGLDPNDPDIFRPKMSLEEARKQGLI